MSRQDHKRNLVLGAVRGYSFDALRPFVFSLKRTSFSGDLVLLWNDLTPQTCAALEQEGVKLVHFHYRGSGAENSWSRFWPKLRPILSLPCGEKFRRFVYRQILNLAFVRFIHELHFLEANAKTYNNVLLTDVRDVLFQDDPFRDPLASELVAFLEAPEMRFGTEPMFNDSWIRTNYNEGVLQRLEGYGISCCGTVMGTAPSIVRYLRAFVGEIRNLTSLAPGADTSIHNVLVREKLKNRFSIAENLAGAVGTLGNESHESLTYTTEGLVRGKNGRAVPVLHQYEPEKYQHLLRALGVFNP